MIACGDRNGSIGIFTFDDFKKIATIEAHDAEIMVLDFAVIGIVCSLADVNGLMLPCLAKSVE